tara:strand:- start:452 stop:1492 length:1041 start_codon:yes stop_codon:yes gene_type:complete
MDISKFTWTDADKPYFKLLDGTIDDAPGHASGRGQVILVGPTQCGKTTLVQYWAQALHGWPVVVMNPALSEPEDISGIPYRRDTVCLRTRSAAIPPEFASEAMSGKWVLFIDEMDKARPETLSALLTLLAERRIERFTYKPAAVVCACNMPRRPLAPELMARLIWAPYPPAGYNVLDRDDGLPNDDKFTDIFPETEPQLPELPLTPGAMHKVHKWQLSTGSGFWNPQVREKLITGLFPETQAQVLINRYAEAATINGIEWAKKAGASDIAGSLVSILSASSVGERTAILTELQSRAQNDPTGEALRALKNFVNSPAAQALTDGTQALTGAGWDALKSKADKEMSKK